MEIFAQHQGPPLDYVDRPPWRLRLGLCGVTFFLTLAVVFRLRTAFLGLSSPVTLGSDSLMWVIRLLIDGVVIAPLLHRLLHRASAATIPVTQRRGYGRMLLAPLALNLVALPLLAVRAVSPDITVLIAVNNALAASDLLLYFALRRFPATARIVEQDKRILVYPS